MSLNKFKLLLSICGPGIVVMLADTDAGSIITAAQTGAVWGYQMLALQLLLIPVLYVTQELTVRMGITTGMGYAELIQSRFGNKWAWLTVSLLVISCIGAIITQFIGIVGVGSLFGIPAWLMLVMTVTFLLTIVMSGSYRSVERWAIFVGLFELVFIFVAWMAHPSISNIYHQMSHLPPHSPSYLYLAAANIGAVIMPWMIFYQQSAVVDKGLKTNYLKTTRIDTFIGAIVTQIIMIAVIITTAATIGKTHAGVSLHSVGEISSAITPFLGVSIGRILFALGILGASLVALIVVSLTAVWALGEVTGYDRSLEHKPLEAPWFYSLYAIILVLSGSLIFLPINLIKLSVAIEAMNALLLPVLLGFLFLLAIKVLPDQYRLKGIYAWIVGILLTTTSLVSVVTSIAGSI